MTFVVVVLGGIGSVAGSYVAGIGLGMFTAFFGALRLAGLHHGGGVRGADRVLVLRPRRARRRPRGASLDDGSAASGPAPLARGRGRLFAAAAARRRRCRLRRPRGDRDLGGHGLRARHLILSDLGEVSLGAHGLLRGRRLRGRAARRHAGWGAWATLAAALAVALVLALRARAGHAAAARVRLLAGHLRGRRRRDGDGGQLVVPRRLGRRRRHADRSTCRWPAAARGAQRRELWPYAFVLLLVVIYFVAPLPPLAARAPRRSWCT